MYYNPVVFPVWPALNYLLVLSTLEKWTNSNVASKVVPHDIVLLLISRIREGVHKNYRMCVVSSYLRAGRAETIR